MTLLQRFRLFRFLAGRRPTDQELRLILKEVIDNAVASPEG